METRALFVHIPVQLHITLMRRVHANFEATGRRTTVRALVIEALTAYLRDAEAQEVGR